MADATSDEWANLRRQWFGSVYEISNLKLQRSAWLAPPTSSPHWSYVEFCCSFPQPDQLEFALDRAHLSTVEFDLLAALGEVIARHKAPEDQYDHLAILADPAWHVVVAKAEKTRQELLELTKDPIERSHLMDDPVPSLRAQRSNP